MLCILKGIDECKKYISVQQKSFTFIAKRCRDRKTITKTVNYLRLYHFEIIAFKSSWLFWDFAGYSAGGGMNIAVEVVF